MKYLTIILLLFSSVICQAQLVPLSDQSLAEIRAQAEISLENEEQNKINNEISRISQITLFSQQGHSMDFIQQASVDNLNNDSLQNLSTQLMLSSIPFIGWLFLLSEMENITISP